MIATCSKQTVQSEMNKVVPQSAPDTSTVCRSLRIVPASSPPRNITIHANSRIISFSIRNATARKGLTRICVSTLFHDLTLLILSTAPNFGFFSSSRWISARYAARFLTCSWLPCTYCKYRTRIRSRVCDWRLHWYELQSDRCCLHQCEWWNWENASCR